MSAYLFKIDDAKKILFTASGAEITLITSLGTAYCVYSNPFFDSPLSEIEDMENLIGQKAQVVECCICNSLAEAFHDGSLERFVKMSESVEIVQDRNSERCLIYTSLGE